MALASKVQALALKAALTIFGVTFKRNKDNKINNNKLIVIYVLLISNQKKTKFSSVPILSVCQMYCAF